MTLPLVAAGIASPESIVELERRPEFRKATRNMLLACAAAQSLAPDAAPGWLTAQGPKLATILATGHGELEATALFLKGLGATGTARPFLFQNSLHNATLGFLTQRLGLIGPGFTVSARWNSGEEALLLARDLLAGGDVTHCLVVGVDSVAPGLEKALRATYPAGTTLRDGAGALLVGGDLPGALARLGEIEQGKAGSATALPAHYDASAIETIAEVIGKADVPEVLGLRKPDGTTTRILFQR